MKTREMSFVEREAEDLLANAFEWRVCKRRSPVVLVDDEAAAGDEAARIRREILQTVRSFGDANRSHLLGLVPAQRKSIGPLRRQAEAITAIVHGLLNNIDQWPEQIRELTAATARLPVAIDTLLALVAVHVFDSAASSASPLVEEL